MTDQQPVQQVTIVQQGERAHANGAEQVLAGIIGLTLSGPVGAAASWAAIKGFRGKWFPWLLLGLPMAPICGFASLVLTGGVLGGVGSLLNRPSPPTYTRPAPSSSPSAPTSTTTTYKAVCSYNSKPPMKCNVYQTSTAATISWSDGLRQTYSVNRGVWSDKYGGKWQHTFYDGHNTLENLSNSNVINWSFS